MSLQTIGTEILATPGTEVGVLPASLQVGNTNPYFQQQQASPEQTTDELDRVVDMYYQRPSTENTSARF